MSSTAPARRRAEHLGPERRRPLVLDAAQRIFVERGYAGSSMDAIAAAAGVTKPVVYECYSSKEELFAALLEREERRLLTTVGDALPAKLGARDVREVLEEAFSAVLRAAHEAPDSWRIVFDSERGTEPAVARTFIRGRQLIVARIAGLVADALADVDAEDRARLAPLYAELIAAIGQAGVRTLLEEGSDWTPDELGSLLGSLAARALDA